MRIAAWLMVMCVWLVGNERREVKEIFNGISCL